MKVLPLPAGVDQALAEWLLQAFRTLGEEVEGEYAGQPQEAATRAQMRFEGDWEAGTYIEQSVVRHAGATYVALRATGEEPSGTATDWVAI